jgi:hypothetical protein
MERDAGQESTGDANGSLLHHPDQEQGRFKVFRGAKATVSVALKKELSRPFLCQENKVVGLPGYKVTFKEGFKVQKDLRTI